MLRKLSAVLFFALAWLAAPHARADEAADTGDADAAKATEEPADSEDAGDDEADRYDRDGWYAGLGGGGTLEYFDHGSASDSGFVQLRAGYHFLRFVAVEAQLEYTPKFNGQSGRWAGTNVGTFATWANFKGYPTAPWTGLVQPYALIGVAWMWAREWGSAVNGVNSNGDFAARFGGGIDFYITRNVVLTAETAWVLPTGDLSNFNQLQIGGALQYRFDP